MRWFMMIVAIALVVVLAGCSALRPFLPAAPQPAETTRAVETTGVEPTTAEPTTEAPPEEDTVPPGYDHTALAATWVRTGTEVEGDIKTGGDCTVVITMEDDGTYRITYTDRNFPDGNYSDKLLTVVEAPLYEGCGNDRWMATVDHVSPPNITHALTIRDDCTLVLQNSFTFDGMPMVSYEYFTRIP